LQIPAKNPESAEHPGTRDRYVIYRKRLAQLSSIEGVEMKNLILGLATAGTFAAITVGLASPAMAAPSNPDPTHDAVYSTSDNAATYQQVGCNVSVNNGGTNVNVEWC
jgi:hypothetical protein